MRRWIAVVAVAALATPVAAQEPSIDVAVRVVNLHPSVSVGSVTCALFADPDGPQNSVGYLGSGSKWFQVKGGGYTGTLAVPVKISPQAVPRSYKCALFVIFKDGDGDRTLTAAASRISDPNRTEYRAQFRRAPGSPFVGEVSGPYGR